MSRHASRPIRSLRILLVTFALLLVSTLAASADPLIPAVSTGGSGGGASVDETAFTGIAPAEMPTVGVATAGGDAVAGAYDELLAGSGYESAASQANAPTVAETRGAERVTTPPSQEDVLAGSGYERDAIAVVSGGGESADTLDEMARSQELIALTPGNSIATSSSDDTLTPATASFEDMKVAQHDALAAAELEVATDRNTRSIALIESETPVALAGGTELAINGRGQVAFAETEHALAQNAVAVAELEAATHPNATSTARAEDVLTIGGVLAGGDELAEVPQASSPNTTF